MTLQPNCQPVRKPIKNEKAVKKQLYEQTTKTEREKSLKNHKFEIIYISYAHKMKKSFENDKSSIFLWKR
ncbi:hypothetical protein COY87_02645 [Candidatus Roizmanbacteria bacterium CG_4_10_14_0_8_um_filter_33_9]|uniref:Uncharacterized protein n=1 Tax=Candidatus Roizmanbacteria bacterium CG_4_10_14_0_8_um_filter_33_9 TaxID=1974826 RepID=A0A2M7QJV0_9BACT|nr:MAG: hypothetical protein COY87_02645 [Candidatus Roizmanbacteria bacterium CG_4_10_14_0_8_um_filter_33_9]